AVAAPRDYELDALGDGLSSEAMRVTTRRRRSYGGGDPVGREDRARRRRVGVHLIVVPPSTGERVDDDDRFRHLPGPRLSQEETAGSEAELSGLAGASGVAPLMCGFF